MAIKASIVQNRRATYDASKTVAGRTPITYTSAGTISFLVVGATNSILDSASGFVAAGFEPGDSIQISGSANNNESFYVLGVETGEIEVAIGVTMTNETGSAGAVVLKTLAATPIAGTDVANHADLSGLANDDHAQYHNDTRGDARYAPIAKGVTNGDSHDHSGGDGEQIDHGGLAGCSDDDHTQYIRHNLSEASNDFLVGSGSDSFEKATLAETLTILGVAATAVADGAYTVGYRLTPAGTDGTITVANGRITAITEAT